MVGSTKIMDTPDILQVGKEETYEFIEKLLTAVKDSFHTRKSIWEWTRQCSLDWEII